jgi:hypothetical protein
MYNVWQANVNVRQANGSYDKHVSCGQISNVSNLVFCWPAGPNKKNFNQKMLKFASFGLNRKYLSKMENKFLKS